MRGDTEGFEDMACAGGGGIDGVVAGAGGGVECESWVGDVPAYFDAGGTGAAGGRRGGAGIRW